MFLPKVEFTQCPIKTTLGVLGKKWTMLILWDIGVSKIDRFNRLLESVPGLNPRILSKRLKGLKAEGFIECIDNQKSPIIVRWTLTKKGSETLPILMHLIAFGSKWYADVLFEDKIPRTPPELFKPEAIEIMRGI